MPKFVLGTFLLGLFWSFFTANADHLIVKAMNDCKSHESSRTGYVLCVQNKLQKPINSRGLRPFLIALEEELLVNSSLQQNPSRCHDLTHAFGQARARKTDNLETVVAECTDICTYGCYHGLVETFLAKGESLPEDLDDLCSNPQVDNPPACFHGLGHGLASVAGYDLNTSLAFCDRLQANNRLNCGYGVFMELYEPASFNPQPLNLPENIVSFCQSLNDPYRQVCETTAGTHQYARERDFASAKEVCLQVSPTSRSGCFSGLGQNLYFIWKNDLSLAINLCSGLTLDQEASCLRGLVEAAIISDPHHQDLEPLCQLISASWQPLPSQCQEATNN
jgi:hypothetical protein